MLITSNKYYLVIVLLCYNYILWIHKSLQCMIVLCVKCFTLCLPTSNYHCWRIRMYPLLVMDQLSILWYEKSICTCILSLKGLAGVILLIKCINDRSWAAVSMLFVLCGHCGCSLWDYLFMVCPVFCVRIVFVGFCLALWSPHLGRGSWYWCLLLHVINHVCNWWYRSKTKYI